MCKSLFTKTAYEIGVGIDHKQRKQESDSIKRVASAIWYTLVRGFGWHDSWVAAPDRSTGTVAPQ
jgi:hypothetical protein